MTVRTQIYLCSLAAAAVGAFIGFAACASIRQPTPAPALPPCEVRPQTAEPPLADAAKPEGPVSDTIAAVREGIAFGEKTTTRVAGWWAEFRREAKVVFWVFVACIVLFNPLMRAACSWITRRP